MESSTTSMRVENGAESKPEALAVPASASCTPATAMTPAPGNGALAAEAEPSDQTVLKPVSAAVEAAHFESLNRQIKLLTEANDRMVRVVRRQLFSTSLFISFVRGMALGLGWVFGTTLVVGLLVIFLHHFDSTPLVGEYVRRIIDYLQAKPSH
jgi:hypothetical protein